MFKLLFVDIVFFHIYVIAKGFNDFYNLVYIAPDKCSLYFSRAEFFEASSHAHISVARRKKRSVFRFLRQIISVFFQAVFCRF